MLNLRPGTALVLVVEPAGSGYTLEVRRRVGSHERTQGQPKRVASEEALWTAIGEWADDKLARLGLEKVP